MKTIAIKIGFVLFLLGCISFIALPVVMTSCTTSQQRVSYNTIYSLEKGATSAYDAYLDQVVSGKAPTNSLPAISKAFNKFQASALLALDAVQFNTNALAPASLTVESQDLINLITQIKGH